MNRGSDEDQTEQSRERLPSMRPRFMNRGSRFEKLIAQAKENLQ